MKKLGKIACIFAVIFILAASPAFSEDFPIEELNDALGTFIGELAKSLPFNSTIGLNWSDAYIGPLIGAPPHFGLGLSVGFTPLNFSAIGGLLDVIGAGDAISGITDQMGEAGKIFNIIGGFPIPAYTFDLRLGGHGIPFDVGFKLGWLDTSKITALKDLLPDVGLNYLLVGGDFRYALIDGKALPIRLSVGIGFNHMNTKISMGVPIGDVNEQLDGNYYFIMKEPSLDVFWSTNVIEAKAQVSFPLLIITPYAGVGASIGWSKAGYGVNAPAGVYENGNGPNLLNDYRDELEEMGFGSLTNGGFSSTSDSKSSFNFRAFGGISLNLFVIRIDLTAMYDIVARSLGASVGLRFQL